MRGDLIIQKDTVTDLSKFDSIKVEGGVIAGVTEGGVKARSSERSFRVSLPTAAVDAAGGPGPVRLVMTFAKLNDGGRVYRMVPAGDKPPHAIIRGRK